MDLQSLEPLKFAGWHIKAAVAILTTLFSLFARGWARRVRRWWKLRPFPIINPGVGTKVQQEFIYHADSLINKGAAKVGPSRSLITNRGVDMQQDELSADIWQFT